MNKPPDPNVRVVWSVLLLEGNDASLPSVALLSVSLPVAIVIAGLDAPIMARSGGNAGRHGNGGGKASNASSGSAQSAAIKARRSSMGSPTVEKGRSGRTAK